jgi:hypothetical protein
MRRKVIITVDLEDTDDKYNWLTDTIALEHVIEERLEKGATVHSISVVVEDENPANKG